MTFFLHQINLTAEFYTDVLISSFFCLLLFCSPATEFISADAHEAKDLIASGYRYLDVRFVVVYLYWCILNWVSFGFSGSALNFGTEFLS